MKKVIIILFCCLCTSINAQTTESKSQNAPHGDQKTNTLKIGVITKALQLSAQEAERFWPIYNRFDADRQTLIDNLRSTKKEDKNKEAMSEEQANKIIEEQLAFDQKILELKKKYLVEFKTVLPATKIVKLYKTEAQLRKKMQQNNHKHNPNRSKERRSNIPIPPSNPK
jgi:hypothetical protein